MLIKINSPVYPTHSRFSCPNQSRISEEHRLPRWAKGKERELRNKLSPGTRCLESDPVSPEHVRKWRSWRGWLHAAAGALCQFPPRAPAKGVGLRDGACKQVAFQTLDKQKTMDPCSEAPPDSRWHLERVCICPSLVVMNPAGKGRVPLVEWWQNHAS